MENKLYDKKARGLILLSNVINDYPDLMSFMEQHIVASTDDLSGCPKNVRNIFDNKLFARIELQARAEWDLKSKYPEIVQNYLKKNRFCMYCGKKPIQKVYTIKNQINGK